ncbi:LOW QUALITY PROTEIN: nucleoporin NDC1 [Neosynchiropus ocellatus]
MVLTRQSCSFVRKVVSWRAAASIAWAVLLLPPITAAFVIISRFSPLHPIHSISECLHLLTSTSAILSLILLCGVIVMVGFLNIEYYTVIPNIACSKIALLGQLVHPQHLLNSAVHSIMGLIVGWCAAIVIGGRYHLLGSPCSPNDEYEATQDGFTGDGRRVRLIIMSCCSPGSSSEMCLNEHQLLLLLSGAFVGLSHSVCGVIYNMSYVSFQTVQQFKYLRFKGSLPMVLRCSATQALLSVKNFILFYFFLGYIPRQWVCQSLNLHINSSLHSLDSVAGLLDPPLLFHLWLSATFLLFTWYVTLLLFRIFLTERYSFPVQPTFTEDVDQCLPKVLSGEQPFIVKFLALQDLAQLSRHSPSRRAEVFTLSQPGGHPHNWNAVSRECLSLLADLNQRLVAYHETVATNGRAKSLSTGSERKTSSESSVTSGTEDPMSPKQPFVMKTPASVFARSVAGGPGTPLTAPFTPDLGSPFGSPALRRLTAPVDQCSPWHGTVQSPHVMRRAPKLWSTSTVGSNGNSPPGSPAPPALPSLAQHPAKPSLLTQFLNNRKEQIKNFLSRRVLVAYLFNKLPEASSQALFADSQAHIWALEGLSYLVQASFTEDQFGVVQTTLPSILSCMLLLQEAVDRHFKLPHASSKPTRSGGSLGDSTYKTLRFALRATLKTAIYRITTTFGHHLNAVQMSAEHRKRLQQFLEYKE